MKYICADCGHEQDSMDRVCDECKKKPHRVILKSLIEMAVGSDWRNKCFPKDSFPKSWEQPGWTEDATNQNVP